MCVTLCIVYTCMYVYTDTPIFCYDYSEQSIRANKILALWAAAFLTVCVSYRMPSC